MDRIMNARSFTYKACKTKMTRGQLAMTTSQCGLCLGCYEDGKRIYIEWIDQFSYCTKVGSVEWMENPDHPRGSHNLVTG